MRTHLDRERLQALDPELDVDELRRYLDGVERVAAGDPTPVAMAAMDRSERFGWLVAPASGLLQPSEVHTGLTADPAATLEHLARPGPITGPRLLASASGPAMSAAKKR